MLLDGRVAVVTGTGPNIGGESARLLAANGASVVCMDMRVDQAEIATRQITERADGRSRWAPMSPSPPR